MTSFLPGLEADDVYFLLAALMALAVLFFLTKSFLYHNKFAVRVKALEERRAHLKAQITAPRKRAKKNTQRTGIALIRAVVNKMNLLQKSQVGRINRLLISAAYRSKDAIFIFAFFQLVCPIVAFALGLIFLDIDFSNLMASKRNIFIFVGGIYMGLKLPSVIVTNAKQKRYYAIQKALSDTLDLLMICSEAGLSLAAALDRVARELANTYPEMADELSITSIELGFLPDRKKALGNLAERVDMAEIRGIVGVLIQTEKYGTPIAQALRVLAAEFREQRMLRAEQKAARLPAIMTLPMIVFILPTLFIVVLSPAIIRSIDNLRGTSMGSPSSANVR